MLFRSRQCRLEGLKGSVGLHGPAVTLLEELSEGCRGGAQVLDEYPVVPREAKEAKKCPHRLGYWPVHRLPLLQSIATLAADMTWHRYATDVAPYVHLDYLSKSSCCCKSCNTANMPKLISPRWTKYQNIIDKDKHEVA